MKPIPKREMLRRTGALNPRPDRVTDEGFAHSDFFDPDDLLQVKYEMLRRVRCDDFTVKQAAQRFGFSRPSFYQAQETFTRGGLGVARSPSESRQPGCRRAFKIRFSAATYSFCSRSSWLTNPLS
jgi:hypothetical protein